ncbi:MAG TPA: hypothetical protein GX701_08545, partial [Clostridiales bacterium]|nr:hypothetical protein [Clostridiales bacterium]
MKSRFFSMVFLFLLIIPMLLLTACARTKPEITTPMTTFTEPSNIAEPKPFLLPKFKADGVVILPEDDIWGLFFYFEYGGQVGIPDLSHLIRLFSGVTVYEAEEAPGPWLTVIFTLSGEEKAAYSVSADNIIRITSSEGTSYYRPGREAPVYETIEEMYSKYFSKHNLQLPILTDLLRKKAQIFLFEGYSEVRLETLFPLFSLPVSNDYTYMILNCVYRVPPKKASPGELQTEPWTAHTQVIPVLLNHGDNTVIELGPEYLPDAKSPSYEEPEIAFLTTLQTDAEFAHILEDANPFIWLRFVQLQQGNLQIVTLDDTASSFPIVLFQLYDRFRFYSESFSWAPCTPPPRDGRQGVKAKTPDDTLYVAVYEGDIAHIKTPTKEIWLQGTSKKPTNDDPYTHVKENDTVFSALRRFYYYWEQVPNSLILKTNTTDPAQVCQEILALWGEKLMDLSPGNPYAVSSFAVKPDIHKMDYTNESNLHSYFVGYSLVPA